MEMHDYLTVLSSQIRSPKARPMVVEEIRNHIEDQADAYIAEGVEKEEALQKAVSDMGDPIEAGVALDRIHRPKMQWGLLALAVVLSLIGLLVQIAIAWSGAKTAPADALDAEIAAEVGAYIGRAVLYTLLSFVVIVAVCLLDYSFLGKHPIAAWWLFLALMIFDGIFIGSQGRYYINGSYRIGYYYLTLMVPLFAVVVFSQRGKGLKGFFKCIALYLMAELACTLASITISPRVEMEAVFLVVMTTAILKGWFGEKKGSRLAIVWIPVVIIPCLLTAAAFFNDSLHILKEYQAARLKAVFGSHGEWDYQLLVVRDQIQQTAWFGSGTTPLRELPAVQNDYAVTAMITYFGWLFALFVICLFLYFIGKAFRTSFRQKNQLGFIVGIACTASLTIKGLIYLITNLGIFSIFAQMSMPFLSYGLWNALVNGVLVGLLLSIYRNKDIVSEKSIKPKYRFTLPIQKVE